MGVLRAPLEGIRRVHGWGTTPADVIEAAHEAAHCIVAIRLGATVTDVEIRRGHALTWKGGVCGWDFGPPPATDLDEQRARAFKNIAVLVAPQEAMGMLDGYIKAQDHRRAFDDDEAEIAKELRAGRFDDLEHRSKHPMFRSSYRAREDARMFAYRALNDFAEDFNAVAGGLLDRNYLTAADVRRLTPDLQRVRATNDRWIAEFADPTFARFRAA